MARRLVLGTALAAIVVLCLSVGAVLLLISAGPRLFGAPDPEQLARDAAMCERGAPAGDIEVHASRELPGGGMLVLWGAICPAGPDGRGGPTLGTATMVREPGLFGGHTGGSSAGGRVTPFPPGQFVEYEGGGERIGDRTYTYIHGRALRPEVGAVEAPFDDGEVGRDTVEDGHFGFISADSRGPCELRVLGENGALLQRVPLVQEGEARRNVPEEIGMGGAYGYSTGTGSGSLASPDACAALRSE